MTFIHWTFYASTWGGEYDDCTVIMQSHFVHAHMHSCTFNALHALLKYIMNKGFVASWPYSKRTDFCKNTAKYLQEHCTSAKRTSKITANLGTE